MKSAVLIFYLFALTACHNGYTVNGVVQQTEMGKDKYMLHMKDEKGQVYRVLVSQPDMGSEYRNVAPGDRVAVSGDTVHWQSEIHIKAKTLQVVH